MIQQGSMKAYIQKGINRSKEMSTPIIVSRVREIKNIDPLLFFDAGKKDYLGERTFWADPTNQTIMVGLGKAYTIKNDGSTNRFGRIESDWKRLIKNQIVVDNYAPYGTGPLLFGGFSFDPLKDKTGLWDRFSDAQFVLPLFMLSIIDGKTWLTTNVVCQQDMDNECEIDLIEDTLLTAAVKIQIRTEEFPFEKTEIEPVKWMDSVKEAAKNVRDGEVEKIVLAREIRVLFSQSIKTESVLANLKEQQPMSYLFAFENGESCFIGASPERLIKKEKDEFLTTCLAGSIKRGKTQSEDESLANELLSDQKNLVEHDVVVQMIKEAMQGACTEITSPNEPGIYKMRDIQHLFTPVSGRSKDGVSLLEMVKKLHPTPALGGQPQQKAIEKIRELELLDRGWYGSPIGWIDAHDNGEFAVAIRSGLLQGNEAYLFAGCGIVGDSEPESEYNETNIKFKPMLSALGGKINEVDE
ncbi:isochorismate synthase [Ferdinandcohnia quinoae]